MGREKQNNTIENEKTYLFIVDTICWNCDRSTITSADNTDTSVIGWQIFEPAP